MAQIKRIVRDNPISNFQQGAPSGGGAFRLLADGLNALYDRVAPVAENEMKQRGESLGREAAKAQFGDNRPYRVQPQAGGSTDTLAGSAAGDDLGAGGDWLEYANQSATRNKPISGELKNAMSFLGDMGVKMKVISGGQDAKGEGSRRTGSTPLAEVRSMHFFSSKKTSALGKRLLSSKCVSTSNSKVSP